MSTGNVPATFQSIESREDVVLDPDNFLREMVTKSKKELPSEGDHKYRPLTLVLAVLYRCAGGWN